MVAFIVSLNFNLCAEESADKTKRLMLVLQSDASLFEKARACQQLGEIGSPEAVPVLARYLADPKLSAYARSGLEGIGDASASAALRNAAPTLTGRLLAGVVNSLGVLRDSGATPLLSKLASNASSGVTSESLLALGNISTREAIHFLEDALANGPETSRGDAAAACLLAADRQRTNGDAPQASELYQLIRKANVPVAYRAAATRGAILVCQGDRAAFLVEQIRSGDLPIRDVALLTIREVPDEALAVALNGEVKRAGPELQSQLLLALADCHNTQSIPVIQALCDHADPQVRRTALTVLGRIGPSAAPALLAVLKT